MNQKRYNIIIYIAVAAAVLGSSEPFGSVDISLWIMLLGLGILLICYFAAHTLGLNYIPRAHVFLACCNALFWLAAMYTMQYWSALTGWDRLIYAVYPMISGLFCACLLVLNAAVYLIRRIQGRRGQD